MAIYRPEAYWDKRYHDGRSSGAGSEGAEGAYKADYISDFIKPPRNIKSVIDWGAGDGQVLRLTNLGTAKYLGVDVSPYAVDTLKANFLDKAAQYRFCAPENVFIKRELGLSMDVLFHLPNDDDYYEYLDKLFGYATRYVVIYSTNYDAVQTSMHVRRRNFTPDITLRFPDWNLIVTETPFRSPAVDAAGFFVYQKS